MCICAQVPHAVAQLQCSFGTLQSTRGQQAALTAWPAV
jgi:hypothetical protein